MKFGLNLLPGDPFKLRGEEGVAGVFVDSPLIYQRIGVTLEARGIKPDLETQFRVAVDDCLLGHRHVLECNGYDVGRGSAG